MKNPPCLNITIVADPGTPNEEQRFLEALFAFVDTYRRRARVSSANVQTLTYRNAAGFTTFRDGNIDLLVDVPTDAQ